MENRVLREAYNEELITMQQRDYLQRKNNEVQDFIDNVQDELEEQLKEISTETIESMKEMIEERYDANIDE